MISQRFVFVALMSCLLVGCGNGSSPQDVTKLFFDNFIAGDFKKTFEYMFFLNDEERSNFEQNLKEGNKVNEFNELVSQLKSFKVDSCGAINTTSDFDKTDCLVKFEMKDGTVDNQQVELYRHPRKFGFWNQKWGVLIP